MLELTEAELKGMAVHRLGNKHRDEGVFVSKELFEPSEPLLHVLHQYFLKPFKSLSNSYKFTHEENVSENPLHLFCSAVFEDPSQLLNESIRILGHLYEKSDHPHIKAGELYVCHFSECVVEGELVDAIGIFKSESRDIFLKVEEGEEAVDMWAEQGINIKKLDKGAFIFNTEKESGYRVFSVDNNNYDAQYWLEQFLNVVTDQNEVFQTKAIVDMCKDFGEEIIANKEDRKEQVMFMNKSMDYMKQAEVFDPEEFANSVIEDPGIRNEFKAYKNHYEARNEIEPVESFEVSQPTLKTARKQVKNLISLDTNIQIKLNFNDPESGNRFIDKGYDEEKEMFYYRVYFNRES